MGAGLTTIIFGGAGFVGLNIAERLLERGSAVTVFDASDIPSAALRYFETLPGSLTLIKGNIQEPESIAQAFQQPTDGVVYGAAITADAKRDAEVPEQIIDVNLTGFIRVLRAARSAGVRRVVNLSSVAAYGNSVFSDQPLNEQTTIADPASLYALTKYATERVALRLGELWKMDIRSVRLSAIYGRWEQKTNVRDTPSPQFQIMQKALSGEPALFSRRDERDWVYAPNIATMIVSILDASKLNFSLYNLSGPSVESAFDWGCQLAEQTQSFECRLIKGDEVPTIDMYSAKDRQRLDISQLTKDIDFTLPFHVGQSVSDYYAWAKNNSWAF